MVLWRTESSPHFSGDDRRVSSPFLRMDDPRPGEILTDGVVHVLARRGLDQLSVGAVARWMKVTPEAVLKTTSRARFVEIVVGRFGERWVRWTAPGYGADVPARLPESEAELHGVRVWHALVELARSEAIAGRPTAEGIVAELRRREATALTSELRHRLGRPVDALEVAGMGALVDGLRRMLAVPGSELTPDQARRIVVDQLAVLRARERASARSPREVPGEVPG